jgi:hypothetical protein
MTWFSTPEAQALLDAIRIERPKCRYLHRYSGVSARYPSFGGKNASALRALWEQAREAAMDANDHEAFAQLTNREHVDDVIELALAVEQLTEAVGDPLLNKRARAA